MADLNSVASDFCAEGAEELLGERSCRDASGSFTGRSAFEDVTGIVKIKLLRTGQVGVSGTRREQFFCGGIVLGIGFDGEDFSPVGPIAIFDTECDRRADGLSMADTGKNVGAVLFDFLAAATTVAELTAVEFAVNEVEVDGESGGQAGQKGEKGLAVRFTRGVETKHGARVLKIESRKVKKSLTGEPSCV